MLGLGWTEMLVIGVVALIFIGPKDLPVVMGRIGKIIGQVQRMGREFQREINKTTGLDEVRNLRSSITSPLKKTADEIRRDFNAIGKDGTEQPSGALKPTNPGEESVVEAIQQQAGMAPVRKSNDELASDYGFKAASSKPVTGLSPKSAPVKAARASGAPKAAAGKRPAAKSATKATAPTGPSAKAAKAEKPVPAPEAAPAEPKPKPVRRSPATKAAKTSTAGPDADPTPAAKPRTSRRKPTDAAGKSE